MNNFEIKTNKNKNILKNINKNWENKKKPWKKNLEKQRRTILFSRVYSRRKTEYTIEKIPSTLWAPSRIGKSYRGPLENSELHKHVYWYSASEFAQLLHTYITLGHAALCYIIAHITTTTATATATATTTTTTMTRIQPSTTVHTQHPIGHIDTRHTPFRASPPHFAELNGR